MYDPKMRTTGFLSLKLESLMNLSFPSCLRLKSGAGCPTWGGEVRNWVRRVVATRDVIMEVMTLFTLLKL